MSAAGWDTPEAQKRLLRHLDGLARAVLDGDLAACFALIDAINELREVCGETRRPPDCWREFEAKLPTRVRNAFSLRGIDSFRQLLAHSARDLLGEKNFGEISLTEVRARLAGLGLRLRGDRLPTKEG